MLKKGIDRMSASAWTERAVTVLETIEQAGRTRALRALRVLDGRTALRDDRVVLLCASNNYLGLAHHPRVRAAAQGALETHGLGSTGSRMTTGHSALHEQLEIALAKHRGTDAALLFNTGYMANLAVMTTFAREGDVLFSDELNHASLIDGCRMSRARVVVYRHGDVSDLEEKLRVTPVSGLRIIVTDGVFSMDGDLAPLADLVRLKRAWNALLIVDDAHATGVLGPRGEGTAAHFGMAAHEIDLHVGTLSKALGSEGGYVAGAQTLIAWLRQAARPFMFSTALSPAVIAGAHAALHIAADESERRERMHSRARELRMALQARGFAASQGITPIIPVRIGDAGAALALSAHLDQMGVFAPAIRPPSVPEGTSRIRLTVTADHTREDVETVANAFASFASR